MIGRIIGNYQITDELARGGMGMIYRGHHTNLPREVIVKEILLSRFPVSTRVQLKARFRRESFIHSQLDHPSIVRFYEAFPKGDNYYLIIEYVQGISLRELLDRQGLPTPGQALYLCKQVLAALDYAHNFQYLTESDVQRKGVIHRDLKPANLLIDGRGKLKVTDFGIVKMPSLDSLAPPSFRPGTDEYMPPEQLRGLDLDVRSDIYSLGVTFYEVVTGQLPFPRSSRSPDAGSEDTDIGDNGMRNSFHDPGPVTIPILRADVSPLLASIFTRAISRHPSERFQSAAEFLTAIKEYERGSGSAEVPPRLLTANVSEETSDSFMILDLRSQVEKPLTVRPVPPQPVSSTQTPSITLTNQQIDIQNVSPQYGLVKISPDNGKNGSSSSVPVENLYDKSSGARKILRVAAAAIIFLGLVTGAYLLLHQRGGRQEATSRSESGIAANVAAPMTTANAATPQPDQPAAEINTGDIEKLEQARTADRLGKFNQAAAYYEDYLRSGPTDANAATVTDQLEKLKKFISYLNAARAAYNRQNYQAARRNYAEALKLRPYSRTVQNGIAQSNARLSGATNPQNEGVTDPPLPPENKNPD